MGIILAFASIPCALTGLVKNATSLAVIRFFVGGFGGSTFVMCQFWTSSKLPTWLYPYVKQFSLLSLK